jgi:hypothetical protein
LLVSSKSHGRLHAVQAVGGRDRPSSWKERPEEMRENVFDPDGCALVFAAILGAQPTKAPDCGALWIEPNTYHKQAAYCFRTSRRSGFRNLDTVIRYNAVEFSRIVI